MSGDKTTPRPWFAEGRKIKWHIDGSDIGIVYEDRADAEMIARAVNVHDDLVAFLERVIASLDLRITLRDEAAKLLMRAKPKPPEPREIARMGVRNEDGSTATYKVMKVGDKTFLQFQLSGDHAMREIIGDPTRFAKALLGEPEGE